MILKTLLSHNPTKWGYIGEIEEIQHYTIDKSNEEKQLMEVGKEVRILKTELFPSIKKEVIVSLKTEKDKYFIQIFDSIAYLMTNEGTTIERIEKDK